MYYLRLFEIILVNWDLRRFKLCTHLINFLKAVCGNNSKNLFFVRKMQIKS